VFFSSRFFCRPRSTPRKLATRSWRGVLRNDAGASVKAATIHLAGKNGEFVSGTLPDGSFRFPDLAPGRYELDVVVDQIDHRYTEPLELSAESPPAVVILTRLGALSISFPTEEAAKTGGEKLSSQTVSAIPLNKRDFSQLLLLAAGTMTDANGQTNFNGQRGVEATFAMDGADTSDPEMGGATFSKLQRRRCRRDPLDLRLDAGGDRSRRRGIHEHHHTLW
jgi:hypothetical protein